MPAILDAVRSLATVGEISGALGETWGRYAPDEAAARPPSTTRADR